MRPWRTPSIAVAVLLMSTAAGMAQEGLVASPSPAPSPSATPAPPQIAFPGQYAPTPAELRYPPALTGCHRFTGEERIACLESLASDYGRLARYAQANAALAPRKRGELRVVFLGDSITDNWSKAGYGGFFPGKPYVNRGIGSHTTSQMLVRFRADVLDLDPDVVVFLAGTNDIAGNMGAVSDEAIQRNLMTMAELSKAHGVRVVLGSVLPVSDDKKDPDGQPLVRTEGRPPARIHGLNSWMAAYARRHGHVYLDYYSAMADASGALKADLSGDGLHPSAAGYAVMALLAQQAIAQALRGRP